METYLRSLRQVRLVVGVSILEKSLLLAALLVVAVIDGGLVGIGIAYLAAGTDADRRRRVHRLPPPAHPGTATASA